MLTRANAAGTAHEALRRFPQYPGSFNGRGIVTCGGGIKYGACAWVLIKLLRHHGCNLPIEIWCLNDDEFDPHWIKLVESLGVTCVNATDVMKRHPHRRLRGWELKPYAILHSRFREVLFLDADNVPLRDPTFLFEIPEYEATGTLFWPDPKHFETRPDSERWEIFGLPFCKSPDQESGQLLIDKERTWTALNLCNWYNEHSDFYYRYVYGDKDTFRFAWQRLGQPISWPNRFSSEEVRFTLIQFDFKGCPLFQHRFYRKWSLYGDNLPIPGFQLEDVCWPFLDELRQRWKPQLHLMRHLTSEDHQRMKELGGERFMYDRPGHNCWQIRLGPNGRIDEGFGPNEFFWWLEGERLILAGTDETQKCVLTADKSGCWTGNRKGIQRMRINLLPAEEALAPATN